MQEAKKMKLPSDIIMLKIKYYSDIDESNRCGYHRCHGYYRDVKW